MDASVTFASPTRFPQEAQLGVKCTSWPESLSSPRRVSQAAGTHGTHAAAPGPHWRPQSNKEASAPVHSSSSLRPQRTHPGTVTLSNLVVQAALCSSENRGGMVPARRACSQQGQSHWLASPVQGTTSGEVRMLAGWNLEKLFHPHSCGYAPHVRKTRLQQLRLDVPSEVLSLVF